MYPKTPQVQSDMLHEGERVVYVGTAVRDAAGCRASPGAVAMRAEAGRQSVLAAGEPGEVRRVAGSSAKIVDLGGYLLLPGLVNSHCHLELTDIGYRPYEGDFIGWIRMVRSCWPRPEDLMDPANADYLRHAAVRGVAMSRAAGVLTVADQSRHEQVNAAVAGTGLRGVSAVELFGLGRPFDEPALQQIHRARRQATATGGRGVGVHPHAPYSAGPEIYRAASASALPCSTHLAETRDELRFVAHGDGPHRDLLIEMGRWDERFAEAYRAALTPVQWMKPYLEKTHWALAHCNYLEDEDIALLARCGASVVYCPRASDYFGHRGHRYRELLEAGVNVAMGTDSIICHGSLSMLDEMRYLHQRDGVDDATLLAMATVNGMATMGMAPAEATFAPGASPGLIGVAIDRGGDGALVDVLRSTTSPAVRVVVGT